MHLKKIAMIEEYRLPDGEEAFCDNCLFWHGGQSSIQGFCRALSPQIDRFRHAIWPITYKYNFCGHWKIAAKNRNKD